MKHLLRSLPAITLVFGACASPPPPVPDGVQVLVERDHRHSKYCGHYEHEGQWYYVHYHRHGVSCGHEFAEGRWILKV